MIVRHRVAGRLTKAVGAMVVCAVATIGLAAGPALAETPNGTKTLPFPLPVSTPGDFTGSNADAISGSDGSANTTFWSFTPATSERVSICTYASPFTFASAGDTTLEVWTGEAATQPVASNDDAFGSFGSPYGFNAGVTLDVSAGSQYVLGLGGAGSATGSVMVRLVPGDGTNACSPATSISGAIRDVNGNALDAQANSTLIASITDGTSVSVPVSVSAAGDVAVPSLPTGSYTINVTDPSGVFRAFHSAPIPVVAGVAAAPQTITLLSDSSITGTLRGVDGTALTGDQIASLHVVAINSAGNRTNGSIQPNGDFSMTLNPAAGSTFTIFVTDDSGSFQDFLSAPITVADGHTSGGHVITLAAARYLNGTLRGPGGATLTAGQVSNLYVSAVNGNGDRANGSIASNGDFTVGLNSITGSSFRIRVVDDSDLFAAFRSDLITVADGETSSGHIVTLALTATAPINPPTSPAPPAKTVRDQHIVGQIPAKAKAKKGKRVALPVRTDAGVALTWTSSTPKVCTAAAGKLIPTGRKGQCRVSAAAGAVSGFNLLRASFVVRLV
ncbi:MAG: hypothetical protein WCP28_07550 [Actinomycetes bacterium]